MSNLVIIESPGKVKTIKSCLGKNYDVIASVGHVRDLPKSSLGIDVNKDFEPKYVVIQGKTKVINELKQKANEADRVFLATDPDREGEAISWHLSKVLDLDEDKTDRVTFIENKKSNYHPLYAVELPIKEKIDLICREIYGAKDIVYSENALKQIDEYIRLGFDKTPICIAKTPLSLTDNPKVLGRPKDFTMTIREIRLSAGAGFLVALTGAVMTMPGLPKVPAAVKMEDQK